jgi:2-C-methyl-D-erythritol 2,4-cyclodiphosphate synthase
VKKSPFKIGYGYDVHRLVPDRELIIGGVNIPSDKGLLGHSDADVLIHAIMDALFGAAGLGDIGKHFPDSDETYKDADSLQLLRETIKIIREKNLEIGNIDSTIIAEAPKMSPYIEKMCENIAAALEILPENINIKATTEEGLGFTGSGEGIAAQAVALLYQPA